MSNKVIPCNIMLLLSLAAVIAAPSQMLQAIMKPQMFQPSQDTNQLLLLQQLQRIQQQMSMQAELQMGQGIMQQIPLLQPVQGTVQQQRLAMQEQMFALQQFQALQRMNLVPSTLSMNSPPILVLFPNEPDTQQMDFNTNSMKFKNTENMGDDDSEIIDAETTEELNTKRSPMRAVLLMPNTRGLIGDLISYIPFLPIEINVPDAIAWMYNGIAGIIAGIGQSLPFRPQQPNSEKQNEKYNVKSIWNQMKMKQQMPIVVIPLGNQLM